jgi:hypothetical protein
MMGHSGSVRDSPATSRRLFSTSQSEGLTNPHVS